MYARHPLLVLLLATALVACQKSEPSQPERTSEVPSSFEAKPAPAIPPKPTSPERIAEIEATGQTGLWATTSEVCTSEVRSGLRTMLVWNVKGTGASRVIVYVVTNDGEERHFGQGGPVGEKETGPWLRPGLVFKIRNFESKEELGSVTITGKSC